MARAKHTDRAEARRRYRQSTHPIEGETDEASDASSIPATAAAKPAPRRNDLPGTGRPSFTGAMRGAYHRANIREDLAHLPALLRGRAFLAGLALVLGGAAVYLAFPRMTGGTTAFELLVLPSSALMPALVTGFFARRASYLQGFLVGIVQAVTYVLLLPTYIGVLNEFGANITPEQVDGLRVSALTSGPFLSSIFASRAAWYRRFLALSSPRRAAGARPGQRPGSKAPARRPAGR